VAWLPIILSNSTIHDCYGVRAGTHHDALAVVLLWLLCRACVTLTTMACLRCVSSSLVFGSQLQELQGRLKRAILEYVILAGLPRSP